MKTSNRIVRIVTLILAWSHTFPALKHLDLFFRDPSLTEAWKGFGGAFAVILYLLPPSYQARGLATLWMRNRRVLVGAGWALACAHLIPATDHLPRFFDAPSWADGWRAMGASVAAVWFVLPLGTQAQVLRALRGSRAGIDASRASRLFDGPAP